MMEGKMGREINNIYDKEHMSQLDKQPPEDAYNMGGGFWIMSSQVSLMQLLFGLSGNIPWKWSFVVSPFALYPFIYQIFRKGHGLWIIKMVLQKD